MAREPGHEGVHGYRSPGRREMKQWLNRRRVVPFGIVLWGNALRQFCKDNDLLGDERKEAPVLRRRRIP